MLKRTILLFSLFSIVLRGMSQDIIVKSFEQLETDLTATTAGTMVQDQNGEKCALIKVATSQSDFTFDAGMMGVVKVVQKPGEIWVYVPAGVKRLSISHVGMESLRDFDLGMSLTRGSTYLLTLKTAKDVNLQSVTFRVTPKTATIMLESADPGSGFAKQTLALENGTLSLKIPVGKYNYTALQAGYSVDEGQFTLTESSPKNVVVEMFPLAPSTSPQIQAATPVVAVPASPDPAIKFSNSEKILKYEGNNLLFNINGVELRMVPVDSGSFMMGSTMEKDEQPVHKVHLSKFYMSETEVTQKLWNAVMDGNKSNHKGDNYPIENIGYDFFMFLIKINKLLGDNTEVAFGLPTEAQWEYAARGGVNSKNFLYSGSDDIDKVAWCNKSSNEQSHEVAQKLPNELGLYDMSGNVSEICTDMYEDYSKSTQLDPFSKAKGLALSAAFNLRGGNYNSYPSECRSTARSKHSFSKKLSSDVGLRLVLVTVEKKEKKKNKEKSNNSLFAM